MKTDLVLAMTGASGAVYAVRLLDCLIRSGARVHLTISPAAMLVMQQELGISADLDRFDARDLLRSRFWGDAGPQTDMQRLIQEILSGLAEGLASKAASDAICYYRHTDYMSPLASGSFLTGGMVICPCSGSTLSAVVHGASNNLIQRAADVHLKERRPLVLVPRETPLSAIQLDNLRRASEAGAVVLPATPGWYHGVQSLADLVDFVVARILDHLGVENRLMKRWGADDRPC